MDNRRLNTVLTHLHHLAGGCGGALTDGQLLGRFVSRHDEAAFELLIRRHGPLVWGVCRRILGSPHDAEDAFQATFLVLIRRAASLDRTRPLSAWLHGVACRVALRAREVAARRRQHERAAGRTEECDTHATEACDLRRILDEELDRLPDKYRTPLVLCYLEGLTHEEAARQLGWPLGTLKCRVWRGRERLRYRLERRGLAPCSLPAVPPPVVAPPAVVAVTLESALHFAAGSLTGGPASSQAVALTQGVLKAMTMSKLKMAAALLCAVAFLAAGAGGLALYARSTTTTGVALAAPAAEPVGQDTKPPAKDAKAYEPAPVGEKWAMLWEDLASEDQGKAWRAAFALAAAPKDAMQLFKGRVKPVTADTDQLAKLIRDLDSDEFDVRERASKELKEVGEVAVPLLRKALENTASVEAGRRIRELLEGKKGPSPAWSRSARAIAVLEVIGGDDARRQLEALAKGQADALPTRASKAALARMSGKAADWQAHYDALGDADEATALRAALAIIAAPKESLPFLKDQVKKGLPSEKTNVDEKLVAKLVADLSDDTFDVREKASKDLIALGAPALPLLRKAREGQKDVETARRLDQIISKIPMAPPTPASRGAGERLVIVLTHLDNADAREVLEAVKKLQVTSATTATSPDGRLKVEVNNGGVQMVDVATGKLLWVTRAKGAATCVAFSPDGKTIAVGDNVGLIYLTDAATGKHLRIMQAKNAAALAGISFTPDGKLLKTVDGNQNTANFEIATGAQIP
jgi:RNA polymerase sigma factor (sigma-70 family)